MAIFSYITGFGLFDVSLIVSALVVLSVTGLCIQRLYLSPAAEIPGPLLAKLTYW
jgi:hypothetical protein